jgi:hypothetical protein
MCGGREQEGLNSLWRQQSAEMGKRSHLHSIRPPPTGLGA